MIAFIAFLPWALIPVLLVVACLRAKPEPTPAIRPYLLESMDYMDVTRSHEAKPSERIREARHTRRMFRALFRCAMACIALAFLFANLN